MSWYDDQALDNLQTFVDIQRVTAPSEAQGCNTYCDSRIPTDFDPYNSDPPVLPQQIGNASFYWCCDPIWLPDLYIANLVQMSQDRWGLYWIGLEQDSDNRTVVHYTQSIQGVFHTTMDFLSFPFDIQALELQILASNVRKFNYDTSFVCGQQVSSRQSYLYQFKNRGTSAGDFAYTRQIQQWNILSFGYQSQLVDQSQNRNQTQYNQQTRFDVYGMNTDRLKFKISRIASFFVLNGLVPILIIVWTSFLVYFINRSKLTDRLGLVVTLLIALSAGNFFNTVPAQTFNVVYNYLAVLSYALISFVGAESLLVYFIMKRGKHVVRNNERINYQRNWSMQDKYSRNPSSANSYRQRRGSQRDQFRSIKVYNNSMNNNDSGNNRNFYRRRGSMSNEDLIQNLKNLFQQRSKNQKVQPLPLEPLHESSREIKDQDLDQVETDFNGRDRIQSNQQSSSRDDSNKENESGRPTSELTLRDQEYGDQSYTGGYNFNTIMQLLHQEQQLEIRAKLQNLKENNVIVDGIEDGKYNQPYSNSTNNTGNENSNENSNEQNSRRLKASNKNSRQRSIANRWYKKPFVSMKNFLMRIEDPNQADLIGFHIDRISLIVTFTSFHAFLIVFAVVVARHNNASYC